MWYGKWSFRKPTDVSFRESRSYHIKGHASNDILTQTRGTDRDASVKIVKLRF